MRRQAIFPLCENFQKRALEWANEHFESVAYLLNNKITFPHGAFPEIMAVGEISRLSADINCFDSLKNYHDSVKDWLFGYFTYDLKNELEDLSSSNPNRMQFPSLLFFQPETMLHFEEGKVRIASVHDPQAIYKQIAQFPFTPRVSMPKLTFQANMEKEEYLHKVEAIKQHIFEGDIYEMNFCLEFFSGNVEIEPTGSFFKLQEISPSPFSVFFKNIDKYLLSASPERFLKKENRKLISQPIKGTIKRGNSTAEDNLLKSQLYNDEKERAENMMIVDLVRNDLARSSAAGSVKVEELFGIYSFTHLHQMISTICSDIKENVHFIDAIKHAFPMGSMTGAPKIKVMELTDRYENVSRGLYSGAAGYITPDGNFDFNVVIRSILYNQAIKMLSFQAGSAITCDSVAEKEYEECLLKGRAIFKLFGLQ